jgi:hypothetical protein
VGQQVLKLCEIDRLIEERIFGTKACNEWKQVSLGNASGPALVHGDWTNPVKHDYECYPDIQGVQTMQGKLGDPPQYTTDIAAAWQLVERMYQRGFSTLIVRDAEDSQYEVEMRSTLPEDTKEERIVFRETTAQLAICLAALKAYGLDVDVAA